MLPKGFVATGISFAKVDMLALVGIFVSTKPGSSQEFLSASLPITVISSLFGMRTFDVGRQMLVVCIILRAAVMGTFKWSLICM